jgi:imidazolonepropionase-like amidohydrolase
MTRTTIFVAAGLLAWSAAAPAAVLVIKDAKIHTLGAAGTLDRATLVVRNDRIDAVGANVAVPDGARVVDGSGLVITPGLFDAYTQLGIKEIDGVEETNDEAASTDRYSAALDVTDALNPESSLLAINRIEGITRALSAPQAGDGKHLFAGMAAVIDLGGGADFVTRPRAAMLLQMGEGGASRAGGSRPAAMAMLRQLLEEVRHPERWSGRNDQLLSPLDVEALKPVLAGDMPVIALVDRAADILALLRLADEYGLRLIVRGGAEAHRVAAELAAHRVPVILDPTADLPSAFESLDARADSAARLLRAGVMVAISGGDSYNSRNIRQLAGNAVAQGMPWTAALAAITLNPARIYGVDGTLGSLEAGKIADFVVWDGDPLEVTSFARQVYIDGRAIEMKSRQTLLRDRYLPKFKAPPLP